MRPSKKYEGKNTNWYWKVTDDYYKINGGESTYSQGQAEKKGNFTFA